MTQYYKRSKNTADVAYDFSLINFCGIVLINVYTVFNYLNIFTLDLPKNMSRSTAILFISGFVTVFYISLKMVFKEKDMESFKFPEEKIKKGNIYLILYIIVSFAIGIFRSFIVTLF